jgi:plastocyanin
MRKILMPAALLATGLLVLGACGSSSSGAKSTKSNSTAKTAAAPVTLPGQLTNKGTKDLAGATTVSIEADDNYFNPTFIKATPGQTITVQLKNEGKATHTFTIGGGVADQMLNPDQKATVQVKVPASGALNFYCRFHRSLGMQGAVYTAAGQSVNAAAATGAAVTSAPSTTGAPSTAPPSSSSGSGSGYGY